MSLVLPSLLPFIAFSLTSSSSISLSPLSVTLAAGFSDSNHQFALLYEIKTSNLTLSDKRVGVRGRRGSL